MDLSDTTKLLDKVNNMKLSEHTRYFFLHIPKTGGTMIRHALYGLFPQKMIFPNLQQIRQNNGYYPPIEDIRSDEERMLVIQLVAGHYRFSDMSHLKFDDKEIKTFTFLRDPIQRVISHVFHGKSHSPSLRNMTVEEIINNQNYWPNINNLQTRYFAPISFRERITETSFTKAIDNLSGMDFIGTLDDVNGSLSMLSRFLGLDRELEATKLNENTEKNYELITDDIRSVLREQNLYDTRLYNYACELIQHKKSHQ